MRQSSARQSGYGDDTRRSMMVEEPAEKREANFGDALLGGDDEEFFLLNWLKLAVLILFTYGLVVLMWVIR